MNPLRTIRFGWATVCIVGFLAAAPVIAQKVAGPSGAGSRAPKNSSPFENVPEAEPNQAVQQKQRPAPGSDRIEAIEFRGARRLPADTLRAMIFNKPGDVYREDRLQRDVVALWKTNRFDDVRLETERGERGGVIVQFVLAERRAGAGDK